MLDSILEPLAEFILATIETLGYGGIFLLMALESANIPIPSEITMPFAGFLVSRGIFSFWLVVFIGALANVAGSLVSYWLAVRWGSAALSVLNRWRLLTESDYVRGEAWVSRHGQLAVFVSRLLPVVRTFISFPAGIFRLDLKLFIFLTFVGSFGWSWLLTYVGFKAGENWNVLQPYFHKFDYVAAAVIVIGAAWWIYRHGKARIK